MHVMRHCRKVAFASDFQIDHDLVCNELQRQRLKIDMTDFLKYSQIKAYLMHVNLE